MVLVKLCTFKRGKTGSPNSPMTAPVQTETIFFLRKHLHTLRKENEQIITEKNETKMFVLREHC